jgi:hypothetical protein
MNEIFSGLGPVHFLPILTTLFSVFFLFQIGSRYLRKGGTHLLWWAIGVFTYGLGTLFEALITLHGNTILLNKLWYVAGAILGGYPLATGSVYLHFRRRIADTLTWITVPFIVFASVCVFLSPVNTALLESFRPSGAILEWQWVRLLTPFINTYSVIFLIGSALYSAIRFSRFENGRYRAIGNTLITVGALLPGIGGAMAKAGMVEALYIGEFVGIILIWLGYRVCLSEIKVDTRTPVRIEAEKAA